MAKNLINDFVNISIEDILGGRRERPSPAAPPADRPPKVKNKVLHEFITEKLGYSYSKFAEMAGVSPATVTFWLSGRPPKLKVVERLARDTGTSMEYLYEIFNAIG